MKLLSMESDGICKVTPMVDITLMFDAEDDLLVAHALVDGEKVFLGSVSQSLMSDTESRQAWQDLIIKQAIKRFELEQTIFHVMWDEQCYPSP